MKTLEENVEQSLLQEERALLSESDGTMSDDVATLQRTQRDMKLKYEVCWEF